MLSIKYKRSVLVLDDLVGFETTVSHWTKTDYKEGYCTKDSIGTECYGIHFIRKNGTESMLYLESIEECVAVVNLLTDKLNSIDLNKYLSEEDRNNPQDSDWIGK